MWVILDYSLYPGHPRGADAGRPSRALPGLFWVAAVRTVHPQLGSQQFISSILLVIVVLFQHDIRRALTEMGRGSLFGIRRRAATPHSLKS